MSLSSLADSNAEQTRFPPPYGSSSRCLRDAGLRALECAGYGKLGHFVHTFIEAEFQGLAVL